jgi:hypothetical protein
MLPSPLPKLSYRIRNPSASPKKSSPKVVPSTLSPPKSEKLDVIAMAKPQPIVDPIVEPQPTSVPDGHWSQEEMEGYFNHY